MKQYYKALFLSYRPRTTECSTSQYCDTNCYSGRSKHTWALAVNRVSKNRTYVRTYARSITWQPKEKRLTIIYGYGALSHARFARVGAPLIAEVYCNQTSLIYFKRGFSCCPYCQGVRYSRVSPRRELIVVHTTRADHSSVDCPRGACYRCYFTGLETARSMLKE